MSGPELPVIYENPRFDTATPTLWPVFDRAMRFTLVILMEWGTLTLIEDAPRYVKFATVIIAALGLAVHESWPWLRMRDWRWYPSLMIGLIATYVSIFGYALYTEPHGKTHSATLSGPSVAPALNPVASNPKTELLYGPYEPEERRKMILALGELRSALEDANAAGSLVSDAMNGWLQKFQSLGAQGYSEKLLTIVKKVGDAEQKISRIITLTKQGG